MQDFVIKIIIIRLIVRYNKIKKEALSKASFLIST